MLLILAFCVVDLHGFFLVSIFVCSVVNTSDIGLLKVVSSYCHQVVTTSVVRCHLRRRQKLLFYDV